MKRFNSLKPAALVSGLMLAAAATCMTGCENEPDSVEDVADTVGDGLDDAADAVDDSIDDAADAVDDIDGDD